MKIEVRTANRGWTWAIVARNGRQIANNEVFASRSNAERAAKSVVRSIIAPFSAKPRIEWKRDERPDGTLRLTYIAAEWQEA